MTFAYSCAPTPLPFRPKAQGAMEGNDRVFSTEITYAAISSSPVHSTSCMHARSGSRMVLLCAVPLLGPAITMATYVCLLCSRRNHLPMHATRSKQLTNDDREIDHAGTRRFQLSSASHDRPLATWAVPWKEIARKIGLVVCWQIVCSNLSWRCWARPYVTCYTWHYAAYMSIALGWQSQSACRLRQTEKKEKLKYPSGWSLSCRSMHQLVRVCISKAKPVPQTFPTSS